MNTSNPVQESFVRLGEAEQLRQQGRLDRAITICEGLVRRHPDYWGAQHTLGLAYADKKNFQRALDCLVRAAMLNPMSWTTLTALSGVYLSLGAEKMAAQTLEQARQISPRDASVLCTLGEIYRTEQEFELALDCFRQALTLEPDLYAAAMGFGLCSAEVGDSVTAAQVFEKLVKRGSKLLEPLFELAGLPASVVDVDLMAELDRALAHRGRDHEDMENSIVFAKAAALNSSGRFAEAWQHLALVNRKVFSAKRKEYDELKEAQRLSLASLRATVGSTNVSNRSDPQTISLFIIGPSRSGKTTLERLTSVLDGVKRGYESPIVRNSVRRTFQSAGLLTSVFLDHLPPQLLENCRDAYGEELARRAGTSKVFTNTNPVHIFDAARMINVIPNVRVVLVKRSLEDNLLRVYMSEYDKGNSYAYDVVAARDHLLWYNQMIDSLAAKFPEVVRVVHYEDMVADPVAVLKTVAELCGLPMNDAPLPKFGDDRGCSEPYRAFIAEALVRDEK